MPIPVDELTIVDSFPIEPDTDEYEALSFLVANHKYGFTPGEVATHTTINPSNASETMARLFEWDLIRRTDGVYYIEPDRADTLKQRLESLDAVVQLFESTPDNDAYAEEGWEEKLPSIDPEDESAAETRDPTAVDAEVEDLISDLENDTSGA